MGDQAFTSLLTQTVKAPRLSGTKITSLTELFIASLDTSHITTFFKLNRSLPHGGQARISSLYVFDALSRAAHKESVKGKRKADAKRCLDGLEAVSENWVDGMMVTEGGGPWAEGKEKARKVIDIWRKTETFPSDTTERLTQKLTSAQPVASGSGSTTPPYEPGQPPPISPALPPLDLPGASSAGGSGRINGQDKSRATKSPPIPQSQSSALPADILKLLGASASASAATPSSGAGSISNNPGSAELAAILANLPKTQSPTPNPNSGASANTSATPTNSIPGANPLAGLNLNFEQLAELAKVAQKIQSPLPQNVHSPLQNHQQQAPRPLPGFPGTLPQQGQQAQGFITPTAQQAYGQFNLGPGPQQHQQQQQQHGYPDQHPPTSEQRRGEEGILMPMPPGTSRNYGRVKPLKNPSLGVRGELDGRSPLVPVDEGYQRSGPAGAGGSGGYHNRRESGDRPPLPPAGGGPPGGGRGWDRERSKSPDRRDRNGGQGRESDGGWGNRGRSRGGYPNQGSRDGFGQGNGHGNGSDSGRGNGMGGDDLGRDRDRDRDPRPPIPTRPIPQTQTQTQTSSVQSPTTSSFGGPSGSGSGPGGGGGPIVTLDTFDMSTFNPMDANSWSTLGEAWKASRGTEPNQMELMGWMQEKMMGGGGGGMGMGMGMGGGQQGPGTGMGMNGGGGMGMGMNGVSGGPSGGGGWDGHQGGRGGGGGGWGGQQGQGGW